MVLTAVVGAGTMGNGIAHSLALGGFDVALVDALPEALERALASIDHNLEAGVARGSSRPSAQISRGRVSRPLPASPPPPRRSWS